MILLFLACGRYPEIEVQATLSPDISTIVQLSWTNPEALATQVRYGVDGDTSMLSPALAVGETGGINLLGLAPDREVSFEVVEVESEEVLGTGSITTGTMPGSLRSLEVGPAKDCWDGLILTTYLGAAVGPIVLNPDGKLVWWHEEDPLLIATRARLSADGQWITYIATERTTVIDTAELVRVSIDGSTVVRLEIPGLHHDFVELPDGKMAVLSQDTRKIGGKDLVGDRILEVAEDGSFTEVWNIFDDWPEAGPETNLDDSSPNWSHANVLHYDEAEDAWYMSFRNFNAIAKVGRSDRQMKWVLGGVLSDFSIEGDSLNGFEGQHGFEMTADGIVVMDDRSPPSRFSRMVEYDLDFSSMKATFKSEYHPKPEIATTVLGDVDRLENGNTLVMFSTAGELNCLDSNAEVLWRGTGATGYAMGYIQRMDSLYPN
jgi:Arylsulfotransferase (ASST)